MKSAVITFPGSNCDRDAIMALEKIGSRVEKIWYKATELPKGLDLIVIPGGFSYGDYLRSGAMAAISSVMQQVKQAAARGVPVLGICNGFQILTEAGLLEGVLLRNKNDKFICRQVYLRVENNDNLFNVGYKNGQVIEIPIAHMDGNYFTDKDSLKKMEDNNQIAFHYVNQQGKIDEDYNHNGSMNAIAGVFNKEKNVLGMMPHPERAIDKDTGLTDGLVMFKSLLGSLVGHC